MTSVVPSSPVSSSGAVKQSQQTSEGRSYVSPSRRTATVSFLPSSAETDVSSKETFSDRKAGSLRPTSALYSTGIAEEKEELLALLEDIPQVHQSIHPSYTLIPWAYKLFLAVDRSEPSEMAKTFGIMSSSSDGVAEEGGEEKEGSPQLEDVALPPSLSLAERRTIYQMVHSVLARG